jgi:transposase
MIPQSEDTFCGCFTDQHGFLLAKLLARADGLDADLADLDAKLAELIAPLARAVQRRTRSVGSAGPPRTCSSPSWERT